MLYPSLNTVNVYFTLMLKLWNFSTFKKRSLKSIQRKSRTDLSLYLILTNLFILKFLFQELKRNAFNKFLSDNAMSQSHECFKALAIFFCDISKKHTFIFKFKWIQFLPGICPDPKRFQGYTCGFTNTELSTDTTEFNLKNIYKYELCFSDKAVLNYLRLWWKVFCSDKSI